jgi:hypothetical protein
MSTLPLQSSYSAAVYFINPRNPKQTASLRVCYTESLFCFYPTLSAAFIPGFMAWDGFLVTLERGFPSIAGRTTRNSHVLNVKVGRETRRNRLQKRRLNERKRASKVKRMESEKKMLTEGPFTSLQNNLVLMAPKRAQEFKETVAGGLLTCLL